MKTFRGCFVVTLIGLLAPWSHAQVTFSFDYSKDTNNFFNGNANRQATLTAAASYLSSFLTGETLSAITPGGANGLSWTSTQPDPRTGSNFTLSTGPSIAANTIIVYVGAYDLPTANQLAFGSQGSWTYGYSAGGNAAGQAWRDTIFTRGLSSTLMAPKIGAISFDSLTSWYYDSDITTVETFSGSYDFFSVAVHELTHILGQFNGSSATDTGAGLTKTYSYGWTNNINLATNPDTFFGTNATTAYGSVINLTTDGDHWADGTQSTIAGNPDVGGTQDTLMDPTFNLGVRKYLTDLDVAGLRDIGYTTNNSTMLVNITAVPEPSTYALLFGAGALTFTMLRRRRMVSVRPATPAAHPVGVKNVF